jgi:hypothetical protein
VWSIWGYIGKERVFVVTLCVDPLQSPGKKHISAIAFGLLESSIVEDRRTKVSVARGIPATPWVSLPDTPSAMDEHFVESASVRLVCWFVPQMPLAENAGGITGGLKDLRNGYRFWTHPFSFEDRMGNAGAKLVPPGQQSATGWGAGWADVEISEAETFSGKSVDMRSFENRVAGKAQVAISLIVGHD